MPLDERRLEPCVLNPPFELQELVREVQEILLEDFHWCWKRHSAEQQAPLPIALDTFLLQDVEEQVRLLQVQWELPIPTFLGSSQVQEDMHWERQGLLQDQVEWLVCEDSEPQDLQRRQMRILQGYWLLQEG